MFRKILLPPDGSRHSVEAARLAADIATHHDAVVTPVVAVEYNHLRGDDIPAELAHAIHDRIAARARKAVEEACALVSGAGARCDAGKILEGQPVDVILNEAEEGEYDLIVIGSRGVSEDHGYERLVGSVTERVLHRTPCPVLVIRAEPRP